MHGGGLLCHHILSYSDGLICSELLRPTLWGLNYALRTSVSYTMVAVMLSVLVSYTIWSVTLGGVL